MKALKILGVGLALAACTRPSARSIEQRLDELIFRIEQSGNTESYKLENQKFVLKKGSIRQILTFQPGGSLSLYRIEDGGSSTRLWHGDYERKMNFVSVSLEKVEGKPLEVPEVKNLMIAKFQDRWLLVDINTQEKWLEEAFAN